MLSPGKEIFETKRLQLVPFTLELMRATLRGRDTLGKALGVEVPSTWPGPDLAEAIPGFIAQMEREAAEFAWDWLIVHKEERVVVGDVGFMGGPKEGIAEIGYSIVPEYRNQGYATEATLSLIHWALQQREVLRVTAQCLNDNLGSIKVLEKIGMRQLAPEGTLLRWETSKDTQSSDI
jgi:ribosomal-protein-alanine N-acetyltransferase